MPSEPLNCYKKKGHSEASLDELVEIWRRVRTPGNSFRWRWQDALPPHSLLMVSRPSAPRRLHRDAGATEVYEGDLTKAIEGIHNAHRDGIDSVLDSLVSKRNRRSPTNSEAWRFHCFGSSCH